MRTADIEVGKVYRVEADYRRFVKATAVETRVARRYGYRGGMRQDGVRVRLEVEMPSPYRHIPGKVVGDELVLASTKVEREWTVEDDRNVAEAAEEEERKRGIEELLGHAGYALDTWKEDGDFTWRGEWLMVRGELCGYLLKLLAEAEGVEELSR